MLRPDLVDTAINWRSTVNQIRSGNYEQTGIKSKKTPL